MDVLTAAHVYWKCSLAQENKNELLLLSKKLCGEKPALPINPGDPTGYLKREDLRDPNEGLLATLFAEVNRQEYRENFPITRDESKNAARNLLNAGREFHTHVVKLSDKNILNTSFEKLSSQWNAYKQSYLSNDFLGKIMSSKSESQENPKAATGWNDRYYFWQELSNMISENIDKIGKIVKDQLSGNADNPIEVPI
jgi:hypothetical protein